MRGCKFVLGREKNNEHTDTNKKENKWDREGSDEESWEEMGRKGKKRIQKKGYLVQGKVSLECFKNEKAQFAILSKDPSMSEGTSDDGRGWSWANGSSSERCESNGSFHVKSTSFSIIIQ